jgi:hypothetical protein
MAIWYTLRPISIFDDHLVDIFHGALVYFSMFFGMLHQEKSGNPDG